MSLLQFLLILAALVFVLLAVDAYKRKKLNLIHFLVFFVWSALLLIFSINVDWLDKFGQFFGVARGADLVVYISIILLGWFYLELVNKTVKEDITFSKFVTLDAIDNLVEFRKGKDEEFFKSLLQPQGKLADFLVVVRAYNEEQSVGEVLDKLFEYGFDKVLVVDDGSEDQTPKIVAQKQKKAKALGKVLLLLSHLVNRWWWAANKTAFEFIKRYWQDLNIRWILTFDADGQMDIADFAQFAKVLKDAPKSIYIGSRFIPWGEGKWIPWTRKLILAGSRVVTRILNGVSVTDPHNWYRVLPLEFVQKAHISSDGMAYASELLEEAHRLGFEIVEVPVKIAYTPYSLQKGQKNANAFRILLELIYKKFFYR